MLLPPIAATLLLLLALPLLPLWLSDSVTSNVPADSKIKCHSAIAQRMLRDLSTRLRISSTSASLQPERTPKHASTTSALATTRSSGTQSAMSAAASLLLIKSLRTAQTWLTSDACCNAEQLCT
jgi:hypothetical protein